MIVWLRRHLQTLIVVAAVPFLGWPHWLSLAGILIALGLDHWIVGPSGEFAFRRPGVAPEESTQRRRWRIQTARLVIAGAVVGTAFPLAALGAGAGAVGQGIANLIALLAVASTGSILGLRYERLSSATRQGLFERLNSLPDELAVVDLLPRRASRVVGTIVRVALCLFCIVPFLAALRVISTGLLDTLTVVMLFGLAIFFQFGCLMLSLTLLLLGWWRDPGSVQETTQD